MSDPQDDVVITPPLASHAEADDAMWLDVPLTVDDNEAADDAFAARLAALTLTQQGRLVVSPDIAPEGLEQYRRLAAVLYQAQANHGTRTVMIASTYPSEGKSLTATNLALTLSESYRRRVLLIDADLRRPTLHDIFEIPNLAGVSDWLKPGATGRMPLVQISRHLSLLPGGRPDPDPMSGLVSDRMQMVLRGAAERFDWVVVDAPPVAVLPDANLLSALVDTVIFVVAAGRAPAANVQRAVEQLGRDRIIGVVLNRVEGHSFREYGQASYYTRYGLGAGGGNPSGR